MFVLPENQLPRVPFNSPEKFLLQLEKEISQLHQRLGGDKPSCISIEFYPYVGLRNTVKQKRTGLRIRISDILKKAPFHILVAVSSLLLYKMANLKAPGEIKRVYRNYVNQDSIINVLDVVILVAIILNEMEPSGYQMTVSDLNTDGSINVLDVVILVNIILG